MTVDWTARNGATRADVDALRAELTKIACGRADVVEMGCFIANKLLDAAPGATPGEVAELTLQALAVAVNYVETNVRLLAKLRAS